MKKPGWPTVNNHGRSASCAFLLWSWRHFGERPVWGNFGDFCKTRKATLISTLGHTCHAWMSFMPKSRQVPVARDSTQDLLDFGQPRHFLRFFPPSSTSTSASELRTSCFVVRSICSAWQSEKVSGTQLKDVERCFRGCSRCWSWSSYQLDAWKKAWNVPDPTLSTYPAVPPSQSVETFASDLFNKQAHPHQSVRKCLPRKWEVHEDRAMN
jgi:hypothetical protein